MKRLLLATTLALLVSCEGADPDDDTRARTRIPTDPQELAVWNAVYDDEYKYPDGFYTEPVDWTTSIQYLGDNGDWGFYKLRHTDSREQARQWWYSMIGNNRDDPTITQERETDRYFEFVTVSSSEYATYTMRWRFHKSSYFAPIDKIFNTFHYYFAPELYEPYTIGIYGGDLSAGAVREFIESLWFFETCKMGGDKVLSTDYKETPSEFVYTVVSTGVTGGDWGMHDEIRVLESTFELDKTTREFRSSGCVLLQTIKGVYHPNNWLR